MELPPRAASLVDLSLSLAAPAREGREEDWLQAPPARTVEEDWLHAPTATAIVGGKRVRVFTCLFCDKTFLKSQALGGHQNAHKKERLAAACVDPYDYDPYYYAAGEAAALPAATAPFNAAGSVHTMYSIASHSSSSAAAGRLDGWGGRAPRQAKRAQLFAAVGSNTVTTHAASGTSAAGRDHRMDVVVDVHCPTPGPGAKNGIASSSMCAGETLDLQLRL